MLNKMSSNGGKGIMRSVVRLKTISQQEKGFLAVNLNEVLFGCGFTALQHMFENKETMP